MKENRRLMLVGLIGVIAFVSTGYCFWLMTVPLSYDLVYVVVIGFIVSLIVFVGALIWLFVITLRLRRSSRGTNGE